MIEDTRFPVPLGEGVVAQPGKSAQISHYILLTMLCSSATNGGIMRMLLTATLVITSVAFGQAPTKTPPAQGPPPKNLTVRPDGHVSANQDPANPENFEVHVVAKGDTLWAVSGDVLKNPRLWPQLWEQNEHIINPHWIYPDDKILIRPVTVLSEAKPPEPAPEPPPPPPAPEVEPAPAPPPPPPPAPLQLLPEPERTFILDERKPTPEVKIDDLYCSGFVRVAPIPRNARVISRFDTSSGVLAAEADYVYLSQGSEDGIANGTVYQVVRRTKTLRYPRGRTKNERDLGMHYLEIAYVRVAVTQADFSLARVIHSCGDAIEVGDIMLPFQPIMLPPLERPRSFSPMMTTNSGIKGEIVTTKTVLLSNGSIFAGPNIEPGVLGESISRVNRGIAGDGTIVYLSIGQNRSVKPGDIFIVYRDVETDFDRRVYAGYALPREINRLKGQRRAIGEVIVVNAGERASTALVTYSADEFLLGDSVERR